jgi:HipA-like protein
VRATWTQSSSGIAMARTSELPDTFVVVLGGAVAGTLTRQANATLRFDYDESYQANPEATPVSLSMPLAVRTHQDGRGRHTVTNFLWGLLPENDAVLERWGRHCQRSPMRHSGFSGVLTRDSAWLSATLARCSTDMPAESAIANQGL